jgi:hypothetical protein
MCIERRDSHDALGDARGALELKANKGGLSTMAFQELLEPGRFFCTLYL